MAYVIMAYIRMAYIVMAYIVMAYIVMAYVVMAVAIQDSYRRRRHLVLLCTCPSSSVSEVEVP